MCLVRVCVCVFSPRVPKERKVTSAPSRSARSLRSVASRCSVSCGQPAGRQRDPPHAPDSHHKAPIVLAGWIGSRSACHSAATCITRRHSGACFWFWFLLSCQPHRDTLFCLQAYFTLIWEVFYQSSLRTAPTRLTRCM